MCYSDLGPARPARADPRQQAPRHVPVDVLALPRRRVDRRLHDRLSDGNAAMSPESTPGHAAHPHEIEMPHASLRDYLIGFALRSEEHTSELQSLMRISYAVFCLKKKKTNTTHPTDTHTSSYIHHSAHYTQSQRTT